MFPARGMTHDAGRLAGYLLFIPHMSGLPPEYSG